MDSFMYGVDCRGGYSTYSTNSNYACDLKKKKFCYPFSGRFLFCWGEKGFSHISVLFLYPSPLVFLLLVFYSALDRIV